LGWRKRIYAPRNLIDALSLIKETYSSASRVRQPLFIVDWDGKKISVDDPKVADLVDPLLETAMCLRGKADRVKSKG
jgi:hypothetical protein